MKPEVGEKPKRKESRQHSVTTFKKWAGVIALVLALHVKVHSKEILFITVGLHGWGMEEGGLLFFFETSSTA